MAIPGLDRRVGRFAAAALAVLLALGGLPAAAVGADDPIVLAVTAPSPSRTYGAVNPPLQPTITGFVSGQGPSDLDIPPTCSTSADVSSAVGTYPVTCSGGADAEYSFDYIPGTLTVEKATLTVTADPRSKTAGEVDPPLTYRITSGALVGDDAFSGVLARDPGESVGSYEIRQGTLALSGNYSLSFVGASFTITLASSATTVGLETSLSPAPPRQVVTLTALVGGLPSAQGSLRLQSSPDGATWSDVAGPVAVTAIGLAFGAAFSVTMPAAAQTIRYRAVFASSDPALSGSTSPELVQVVAKAAATVTLTSTPEAWETSIPVAIRATIVPVQPGVTVRAGGTVDFSIDDGPAQAAPVVDGVAELPASSFALGPHTVTAAYSGDDTFLGGATASLTRTVAANLVSASGVGVSGTSIYPVKDGWRDTVAIRGTRNERLGVSIRIYGPTGRLLTTRSVAVGSGPYSVTWNGRTASGSILPPGRYRIVQALTDPSTVPALARSWTSNVALSTRRMTWRTAAFVVAPGPRNYRFSSGQGVGAASTSSAGRLVLAGGDGSWPAVGYEFRLPEADAYRELRFQVRGSASGLAPTLGLQRWSSGAGWGQVYRADFARTSVTPSATTWRGLATKTPAPFVSGTRRVRGYVDGGGRLTGPFRFGMTGVRLVVVYGTLR